MAANSNVHDLLAYSTVQINALKSDEVIGTGTGFFYHFCRNPRGWFPGLVTNKHVITGADFVQINCHASATAGGPPEIQVNWSLEMFPERIVEHPDPDVRFRRFLITSES